MTTDNGGLAEILEQQAKDFSERCVNCGDCLTACPVFPLTKFADKGPDAVMEKITDLLKSGKVTDEACDMIFSCSQGCGHHCMKVCPEGLMPNIVFMYAISIIKKSGKELPPYIYQHSPGHRFNFTSVFSAIQKRPDDNRWIDKIPANPDPVDVVLFGGCVPNGMPHLMSETMDILDKMGIRFVALDAGDRCCGVGHVICGDVEMAHAAGKKLVADISVFQPKQVLFSCLGCYLVIAGTLSMFMEIPFESRDLVSFMADNLEKIPFTKSLDKKVALHDSCVISSMPDQAENTRKLLKAIPGLSLTELKHNRENSRCCGGVTKSTKPHIAEKMRDKALKQGEDAGIQILSTFCAGCHKSFAPVEKKFSFEIKNYISLIAESVGVGHEDMYKKYAGYADIENILSEAGDCISASDFTMDELKTVLSEYLHPVYQEKIS